MPTNKFDKSQVQEHIFPNVESKNEPEQKWQDLFQNDGTDFQLVTGGGVTLVCPDLGGEFLQFQGGVQNF